MGILRDKVFSVFLIIAFLLSFSVPAYAGVSLWPGKLTITFPEGYDGDEISYNKIRIDNNDRFDAKVTVKVLHPPEDQRNDSFDRIPDLSWISFEPENMIIPGRSYDYFTLTIDIPEENRSSITNSSWEVWAMFCSTPVNEDNATVVFSIQLVSKLYIHPPTGPPYSNVFLSPIFMVFLLSCVISFVLALLLGGRKKRYSASRSRVYFFKK